jgi:hypothetical protein
VYVHMLAAPPQSNTLCFVMCPFQALHGKAWDSSCFADGFLSKASSLHYVQFIPSLVDAYSWFGTAFAQRLTLEQARLHATHNFF